MFCNLRGRQDQGEDQDFLMCSSDFKEGWRLEGWSPRTVRKSEVGVGKRPERGAG